LVCTIGMALCASPQHAHAYRRRDPELSDLHRFVQRAGVQPSRLTDQHVRGFLLHLMDERRLSSASHDVYVGAIKFFLRVTMNRPDIAVDIPRRK
jgi:hypothetical protein